MKTHYSITKLKDWPKLKEKGFEVIGFTSQGVSRVEGAALRIKKIDGNNTIEFITIAPHHLLHKKQWVFYVTWNHVPEEWKKLVEYKRYEGSSLVKFFGGEPTGYYDITARNLVQFVLDHHFTKKLI